MPAFGSKNRFRSRVSRGVDRPGRRSTTRLIPAVVETLERRELMAAFMVTNLSNFGAGSFRHAILASNANPAPGGDTIDFAVSGTINVSRRSLPAITNRVNIEGASAPGYAGSPVVTVDFNRTSGLRFARGADGSFLGSLSLVGAGNSGVTIAASNVTLQGNYIGVLADGSTVLGNRGDGVRINASSHGDLIGNNNAVTGVNYYSPDNVSMQPVSGWQGIRGGDSAGQYLITGTSNTNGLLYIGPISGAGGSSYAVDYPGAASTSVYGPNNLGGGSLQLVGSYRNSNSTSNPVVVNGFLFQGTTADLTNPAAYRTIDYPGAAYNYVHSTMGGLAVGNADGPTTNSPLGTGHAFLYNIAQGAITTDIVYPGSATTTAYGIWYNGGTSYTICGGYGDAPMNNASNQNTPIGQAYLVDYNAATGQFSDWTSFSYPNGGVGSDFITHFEGISSVEKGVYTLSADSLQSGSNNPVQGSVVTVRLNPDGSFGPATWADLNNPSIPGPLSSNSIYGNQVVGIQFTATGAFSYQASVNTGFQLSNVISGNGGNGIGIYGGGYNQIAMNNIGTDATGSIALGNARNGIFVTAWSKGNMIGGQATGGNNPTASVFVRPPQGNLISGNKGDGVLISGHATQTTLSGNFIGTTASGDSPLGNRLDGVAIVNANGNQLIGCTFQQSPFVFYNVLSGNGQNGLRITNSNDTTVQANFMGVGANNASIVANGGDGLLVSGTSSNTQVGGVIPLGNVISGDNRNGIEVSGKASGFISFNTFAGIYAFKGAAPNRGDGILITSTGGDNLIRTCIVSGNLGNGIELAGNATGVQITDTAVGTNTNIQTAIPNGGDGIKIDGNAHGNAVGGFQPSVEPQVTVSSNQGYGIEVVGRAHNNVIFHTYIGTNSHGTANLGNVRGGIYLGPGTSSTTIGGIAPALMNKIDYSGGSGLMIRSSSGNAVLGDQIARNAGDGIDLINARNNRIGSATGGNTITANGGFGVKALGLGFGTVVQGNRIVRNAAGNVDLSQSIGIVYFP